MSKEELEWQQNSRSRAGFWDSLGRIGVQAGGVELGPGGRRRIGVQVGGGGLGSRREEAQIH